jgi:hypothetical protein
MSSEKRKVLSEKHGPEALPDPVLAKAIQQRSKDQSIPCAVAFEVARDLKVTPQEIGKTADLLNIAITKCQLGLFGYGKRKKIIKAQNTTNQDLIHAIKEALQSERLPCAAAWEIAGRFNVTKLKVGNVAQANGIKIKHCQLGAF